MASNVWIGAYRQWLTELQSLQNAQMVVNYFINKGWSKNALSAMLGNMRHESSINPDMYEFGADWGADRGYGLVQWTPRSKYWNWAEANGLSPRLGDSQLARIQYEVDNNIQWIQTSSYPLSFAEFRASTQSVDYLTQAFTWNYERPAASAGQSSMPARQAFARRAFNELNWSGITPVTNPNEPPEEEPPPVVTHAWKTSAAESVELLWTPFEATIPVNPEKELLAVNFEIVNEETFPVYFDGLYVLKNLLNDKLMSSEMTYIPIDGAAASQSLNEVFFGALDVVKIYSIHFVPEEAIVGDNENYMQLQVVHSNTANVIATKTFVSGVDAAKKTVTHFGPVSSEHALMEPDSSISLVKADQGTGMKLPKGLLIVRWDIA